MTITFEAVQDYRTIIESGSETWGLIDSSFSADLAGTRLGLTVFDERNLELTCERVCRG